MPNAAALVDSVPLIIAPAGTGAGVAWTSWAPAIKATTAAVYENCMFENLNNEMSIEYDLGLLD